MARIQFSALLSAASGKIGDVVMSRWKGVAYARRRVIPANPQSGDQCKQRHLLKVSLLLWQSIKAWAKAPCDLGVSGYALSGYNKFMDDCIGALKDQFVAGAQGVDPTWTTFDVTPMTPYNAKHPELLDMDAGTGGETNVTFTWTGRVGAAANDMVNGYYRKEDDTAWIAVTPVLETAETLVFADLTNAQNYEFAMVPHDTDAEMMGLSSHAMCEAGA
ncbi:hypothetical protein ES705_23131 [subsurface metagenome]